MVLDGLHFDSPRHDGHVNQLPDIAPGETSEWLDSLEAVVETHGKTRARFLIAKLLDRHGLHVIEGRGFQALSTS